MKQTKFTLTEPEYRALRLKAEEADRLRRAIRKARKLMDVWRNYSDRVDKGCETLDRALARRKR